MPVPGHVSEEHYERDRVAADGYVYHCELCGCADMTFAEQIDHAVRCKDKAGRARFRVTREHAQLELAL